MRKVKFSSVLILIFCSLLSTLHAQNSETNSKNLSIEAGLNKILFNSKNSPDNELYQYFREEWNYQQRNYFEEAAGFYLKFEKVMNDHLSIDAGYSFSMSKNRLTLDLTDYTNSYELHEYQIYVNSLYFGSNWYVISSNLSEDFTPYAGVNVEMTYATDKDYVTSLTHSSDISDVRASLDEFCVSLAPKIGINIPVHSGIGLRLETKYLISMFSIDNIDKSFHERSTNYQIYRNYFKFNMGLKYSF